MKNLPNHGTFASANVWLDIVMPITINAAPMTTPITDAGLLGLTLICAMGAWI